MLKQEKIPNIYQESMGDGCSQAKNMLVDTADTQNKNIQEQLEVKNMN